MGRLWAFFSFVFEAIRLTFFRRDGGGDNGGDNGGGGDVVDHYGCPNSERTRKLQLRRRSVR